MNRNLLNTAALIAAPILAAGPKDNPRFPQFSREHILPHDVETDNPDGQWLVNKNDPHPWKTLFASPRSLETEPDTDEARYMRVHVLRSWEERVARYAVGCALAIEQAVVEVEELANPKS